jgi:hypothetical protein
VQGALIAFFVGAVVFLVIVYVAAPQIYVQTLNGTASASDLRPSSATMFMVAVVAFVGVLIVGVVRRWRWEFWLVLLAFAFSGLQIPVAALELVGVVPVAYPGWYIVARAVVAAIQVTIAIAMLRLHRSCGVWGMGYRRASRRRR